MSTWTPNLNIQLIGPGEQAGTWGTTTNGNWQYCMEDAIVGSTSIVFADTNQTLTATQSTSDQQYRYLYLVLTGANSAQRTLFVPQINKTYVIINNLTDSYGVVVQTASGTGVTVPQGQTVPVYVNGTNVVAAFSYLPALGLATALPVTSGGTGNTATPTAYSLTYTTTYTVGSTVYPQIAYITGNTSTTPAFLSSTGTGSAANAPTLTTSTGSGAVVLANQPTFSATTGNAPFVVNSTTVVANLNAASAAKLNNALTAGSGIVFNTGTTFDGSQALTISATAGGGGVTNIYGTAGQINVSANTGAVTVSISGSYSAPSVVNALTAGTGLTLSSGTTYNGSAALTLNATGSTLNSQTSAYVLAASDAGKTISITTGGVTVNNSIFSAGNLVTIYNNSASSQTITQGTGVTLQWAGQTASTTGNRTLALYGICTILFISASTAVISGVGLT